MKRFLMSFLDVEMVPQSYVDHFRFQTIAINQSLPDLRWIDESYVDQIKVYTIAIKFK